MKKPFGEQLRDYRNRQGLTQKQLAQKMECDQATIAKWERIGTQDDGVELFEEKKRSVEPRLSQLQNLIKILDPYSEFAASEILDFLNMRTKRDRPEYSVKDGVSWIEDLSRLSKAKAEKVAQGINAFKEFFFDGKHVGEVSDLTWYYKTFMDAIHSSGLRIIDVDRDVKLENEIKRLAKERMFPKLAVLKNIVVANVKRTDGTPIHAELVSVLAAKAIFGDLLDVQDRIQPDVIALGRSYTVWRIAQLSVLGNAQVQHWIPLMAFDDDYRYPYSANQIAMELSRLHQGPEVVDRLPPLPFMDPSEENLDIQRIRQVISNRSLSVQAILTVDGVGDRYIGQNERLSRLLEDNYITPTPITQIYEILERPEKEEQLRQLGAELCGMFLNHDAELLNDDDVQRKSKDTCSQIYEWNDFRKRILGQIMLRGKVWVVASGAHKVNAVYMMMKHGLANAFVIDSHIAQSIINKVKMDNKQ